MTDRLERTEMDTLIRSVGVTGHRARNLVLDQADGRPGWALALCEVLVKGGGQDVLTGNAHLANVERYLRRAAESQTALDALACMAALGKMSTEAAHRLAPVVGLPPAELTGLLERLAQHGLLDRSVHGWSLQPSLRAPLVARWFFGEPAQRPWSTLVEAFPDYQRILTISAFTAASTGSPHARKVVEDLVDQLLPPVPDAAIDFGLLNEYATMDIHAGRRAVTYARSVLAADAPRPTHQIGSFRYDPAAFEIAVLLKGAARRWVLPEAVAALLDLAVGDTRPRHSTPDHPLRVLGDLANMIDPDRGTFVEIREQLLTITLEWIAAHPAPARWAVAVELLAKVFSPEVQGAWSDPGNLNTFSFSQGYDTAANLRRLLELVPRLADLFTQDPQACPPEALRPLVDLVGEWFRLAAGIRHGTTELNLEQRHAGRTGARCILEAIRPTVQPHPGLALRAQRVLEHRPSDDQDDADPPVAFELDPDLIDLIGGTREPNSEFTEWFRTRNDRLDRVAERVAALGPTDGTARFVDLTRSARLADHSADGNGTLLAARMALVMQEPVTWLRHAIRERDPALVRAVLVQTLETTSDTTAFADVTTHLQDPVLRPAIVTAALGCLGVDEFTDRVINDLDAADARLFDELLTVEEPTEVHHWLLTHPVPAIAAAAALTFAVAQPFGPALPEEWTGDWRAAVQNMHVDELDHHHSWKAERLLAYLAAHDPDLFEQWFARQLDRQRAEERLHPPEPRECVDALPRLPRVHRERLARKYSTLLHLPRFDVSLLAQLIGEDRELAERLLDDNVISIEQLLDAVTGQRGAVLEQLGPLLLERGVDAIDIAGHAGVLVGARFGDESTHHEQLLNFFHDLDKRVPALQPVAEAGQTQQTKLRDEAKDRERQARVRGG